MKEIDVVECPYCGKEMASGFIPNGQQPVQWIPDGEKPSFFSFSKAEKAVTLNNKFSILKANGYKAEAYFCIHCKIIISPIDSGT